MISILNNERRYISILTLSFGFAVTGAFAHASSEQGPKVPAEVIEACEGLSEGDQCSFIGFQGEQVVGSCEFPPKEIEHSGLGCKPDGMPPRPKFSDDEQ